MWRRKDVIVSALKEDLTERARKAFTAAPGEETSDTYNLDTYGPKKMNRESAAKALEAADSEKARERTRGVKPMKKGGKVSSASSRADGCAVKGKTKGRFV